MLIETHKVKNNKVVFFTFENNLTTSSIPCRVKYISFSWKHYVLALVNVDLDFFVCLPSLKSTRKKYANYYLISYPLRKQYEYLNCFLRAIKTSLCLVCWCPQCMRYYTFLYYQWYNFLSFLNFRCPKLTKGDTNSVICAQSLTYQDFFHKSKSDSYTL